MYWRILQLVGLENIIASWVGECRQKSYFQESETVWASMFRIERKRTGGEEEGKKDDLSAGNTLCEKEENKGKTESKKKEKGKHKKEGKKKER